ncbi:hypothetical protein D3C72_2328810 [compost metagenome]
MMTPASPWIGSISAPTVFSLIAASKASASPKGTVRKPGVKGPKPPRASGSVEKETMLSVRPWKLPEQTMISALPSATPLVS